MDGGARLTDQGVTPGKIALRTCATVGYLQHMAWKSNSPTLSLHCMRSFNPDKTQCIRFSRQSSGGCSSVFMFFCKYIKCVKSVVHLGHVLAENLQDDLDIQQCRSDFIKRANCVLH